ncbi:hypothetical protein EES39_30295 [Streptomyces sp. ADI92-24]|nr:hypothetical protein EES39_30295 [Streptomyces sp. ADI92-24]
MAAEQGLQRALRSPHWKRAAGVNGRQAYMSSMVSTDRLPAFAPMPFLLIVIPGPSVLFVIGRAALAQGRRAALTTVVGNTLGA